MANNSIEIEAKVLVSKADYNKLLENLKFDEQVKIQKNYYLDSNDRMLKKYGIIVRLREREGRVKLSMKAPLSEGLLEKNQMLEEDEFKALLNSNIFPRGEVYDFLEMLNIAIDKLVILAELTTERREMKYNDTKINISKNTYGKNVDYELECDSDSKIKSEDTLKEILADLNIECVFNNLSKETRAINAKLGTK